MASDSTVIGLCSIKINGLFRVDAKSARWSAKRSVTQNVTQGGIRQSTGEALPTGSFEEVVPRDKRFNWKALRNFSIEIYDKETNGQLVFACNGCNWDGIDGNTDLNQALTGRTISWKGSDALEF